MRTKLMIATLMVAAAGPAFAQMPAPSASQPLASNIQLYLEGTSTVRGFKCTAKTISAKVITDASNPADVAVSDLVATAKVVIPVAGIDCENDTMNGHLRKALTDKDISFALSDYTVTGSNVVLKGTLSIAGRDQAIEIPGTLTTDAAGVRVKATKTIDMTQWGVKPPSLMMGTMKVRPAVNITFDAMVKR